MQSRTDIQSTALEHSIRLQRSFGLRARESFALKKDTIRNALKTGTLHLTKADLPKNSRQRDIPITSQTQKNLLKETYAFMKNHNYHSLIHPDQTLRQHSGWAYRQIDSFRKESQAENYHFHGERHSYAHARYEQLWAEKTGTAIKPPVLVSSSVDHNRQEWQEYASAETGLSEQQIREIETDVRTTVSNELGHARIGITRSYLG